MTQSIVLIGFMGVGKTTVGRILSNQLDRPFVDCDATIEQGYGKITDIISTQSEAVFRTMEYDALNQALNQPSAIISTGGGIVTYADSRYLLQDSPAIVMWLKASFSNIQQRLSQEEQANRPLFDGQAKDRFDHRQALYQSCASFIIEVDGLTAEQVAEMIVNRYVNN